MKKYIVLILALVVGIFQYSCNEDPLEITQKGVKSTDLVYANADDDEAEQLIAAVYNRLHGSGFSSLDMVYRIMMNTISDDGYSGATFTDNASTYQLLNTFETTSEMSLYETLWTGFYQVIYWSNMIVENLPDDTEMKQRVIAEAKAMRAISMMYLVRLWGTPPLVDHVLGSDELQMPNTPAETSWAWIESQFEEAASVLPSKSGIDGQAEIGGRLTKEATYAYLGKAQLLQGKNSEAATTLKTKVIDTNLYGLIDNFDDLNYYTSDFSKENIFEYNIANDPSTNSDQGDMRGVFYGYRSEYVVIPDEMIPESGWGYGAVSKKFGEFMEEHERRTDGTLSDRFNGTLCAYEELLDESRFSYTTYGRKGVYNPPLQNNAGYFRIKEMPYAENKIAGQSVFFSFRYHNNGKFMRYAEVLLMYAEAALGTSEGLEALNEVRTRAGLDALSSYTLDNVKDERRAELYFEGERFLDLVRWGDAPTVLSDKGKTIYAFYGYQDGTTEIQSKDQWRVESYTTGSDGFVEGKNEVFPYPLIELQSNPNLVQNNGW